MAETIAICPVDSNDSFILPVQYHIADDLTAQGDWAPVGTLLSESSRTIQVSAPTDLSYLSMDQADNIKNIYKERDSITTVFLLNSIYNNTKRHSACHIIS